MSVLGPVPRRPCAEVVGIGPAIARRLIREGHHLESKPENCRVARTYAGRHQRALGSWSWYLVDITHRARPDGPHYASEPLIGSQWPAKLVLRWKRPWDVEYNGGALHIDPDDEETIK